MESFLTFILTHIGHTPRQRSDAIMYYSAIKHYWFDVMNITCL